MHITEHHGRKRSYSVKKTDQQYFIVNRYSFVPLMSAWKPVKPFCVTKVMKQCQLSKYYHLWLYNLKIPSVPEKTTSVLKETTAHTQYILRYAMILFFFCCSFIISIYHVVICQSVIYMYYRHLRPTDKKIVKKPENIATKITLQRILQLNKLIMCIKTKM